MANYRDVNVDHPRIVDAIKTLTRQGKKVEDIAKVVGMPPEVVKKHQGLMEKKERQ